MLKIDFAQCYIVCYLIVTMLYLFCTLQIHQIRTRFNNGFKIEKNILLEEIENSIRSDKKYQFLKGKYYAYNPVSKAIIYIDKAEYDFYDIFGFYHEVGHYLDDLKNDEIFKHMRITALNRILFVPLFLICTCMSVGKFALFKDLRIIILCFNNLFFLHRVWFICKYEVHASKYSLNQILCKYGDAEKDNLRKLKRMTAQSQFFFSVFGIMTIIFVQIICFMIDI